MSGIRETIQRLGRERREAEKNSGYLPRGMKEHPDYSEHELGRLEELRFPEESIVYYLKTGSLCAALYPLVGLDVMTPKGPGRLIAALGGYAQVVLQSEEKRARQHSTKGRYPGEGNWVRTHEVSADAITPFRDLYQEKPDKIPLRAAPAKKKPTLPKKKRSPRGAGYEPAALTLLDGGTP